MTRRAPSLPAKVPDFYAQSRLVSEIFPQFRPTRWRGHRAWIGTFRPDPGSPAYKILVIYRGPRAPHVYILSPPLLRKRHMYDGERLCVFDPKEPGRRWEPDSWIALTIIPWTIAWLHFYELYLETDRWMGPEGVHRVTTQEGLKS